ncbi:hypothetical protein DFH27DRAFT_31295 [Peziza echinospora]|nr:hypothetical protein DFH27DRAFT_31295 [Peziza echinospora]
MSAPGTTPAAPRGSIGIPASQTLYVTNLNDKINKQDLRMALYTLFTTYGTVLDVVALKTMKMRGQAHIVFRDLNSAGAAMRALQGFNFMGKEMKIQYAKSKSDVLARLDGTYTLSTSAAAKAATGATSSTPFVPLPGQGGPTAGSSSTDAAQGLKRPREEESDEEAEMETED